MIQPENLKKRLPIQKMIQPENLKKRLPIQKMIQPENLKKRLPIQKMILDKKWLGPIDFEMSLKEQKRLKDFAKQGSGCFLGFESKNSVITKGLRATSEDILWDQEQLKKHSIDVLEVQRGGQATLHTFGQLIIYPVVSLPLLGVKVKDFILSLESITQFLLEDLGVVTKSLEEYAGLSTPHGKISFFGIHISEGVSQHGLSINIFNDLSLFSSIKSCGVSRRDHDSLFCQKVNVTSEELFYKWTEKAELFFTNGI